MGGDGDVEDIYPLTPLQEGMLFHSLYSPTGGDYVRQLCFRLGPEVDPALLETAWSLVVNRHPALRSSVEWRGLERPLQLVHRHVTIPVEHCAWHDLDEEAAARWRESVLADERTRGLDMATAPLMRLTFLTGRGGQREVVWTFHHLLFDGWTRPTLLGELRACYRALAGGESPSLPDRRPYRDYIAWLQQRHVLADEAWWRGALEGFDTPTRLLGDGDVAGNAGNQAVSSETLLLSAEVSERVRRMTRESRLTVSTLLIGAWGLLLSRYTRSTDVVLGLTVSGRPADLDGVESMVGLFINTVPVRVTAPEDELVRRWLQRLQAEQVQLREHEHTPLVDVQAWSQLPPNTPLFDTLMVFGYPLDAGSTGDADDIFELHRSVEQTNYALTLMMLVGPRIEVTFVYDGQRFSRETVLQLSAHLERLLEGMVANPDAPLRTVEMLTADETRRQVVEWNATVAEFPRDACVHQLVLEQARRTPDAIALSDDRGEMTYAELDEQTARLAAYLRAQGLGPDVLAGVSIPRSVDMVVAVLGVLRAGGAYVPLDPDQPAERLALMLASASPALVLTTSRCAAALRGSPFHTLCIDGERHTWMGCAPDPTTSDVTATNLAYVLFTSGSTGAPKGVMVEHRALVNQLVWRIKSFKLGAEDRVLQKTPLGFDVSLWELFCPLIAGARLVLLQPEAHRDPMEVAAAIRTAKITALHFVPSMLEAFLSSGGAAHCESVRLVACSGETLTARLAERFFGSVGAEVELRNLYGPTEAAVDVTSWRCDPQGEAVVPIGRPVANTQIHLLDGRLRPLPVGVVGELYIGGVQLARGYLNRPDLTDERFVDNPFRAGERLYRTGDLARYRPDGVIEFLGRNDSQVKIRGVRIELGEIEAALLAHPEVAETIVLAWNDDGGEGEPEQRLVAYVVPATESAPRLADLRNHLATRLPSSIVPNAFVLLEEIPLTPSGKVDRRALPAPQAARLNAESRFVPPRNDAERRMAAIWARSLGVQQLGVHDDFFEAGGHSLLAVRVLGEMEREFGVAIPLTAFFGGDVTVATLAATVESAVAPRSGSDGSIVDVQPVGASPVIFFVYPDESSMLVLRHFTEPLGSQHRLVGLLPDRDGRRFDRRSSVQEMAVPMLARIRTVQPSGPYRVGGYSFGGLLAYELASRLRAEGEEVAWVGLLDARLPSSVQKTRVYPRPSNLWQIARQPDRGPREAIRHADEVIRREFRALLVRLHIRRMDPRDYDWRGARKLAYRYRCSAIDAPLHVFASADTDPERVSSLGWDSLNPPQLHVHHVPGDHMSMVREPYVSILANELVTSLTLDPPEGTKGTVTAATVNAAAQPQAGPAGEAAGQPRVAPADEAEARPQVGPAEEAAATR